ncbi:MAG: hypothetical protein KME11_12385 [Timaviella obliquedivisa GSE-PSE-MK23-08B]|jgi:hypothetical protein|nr:hypothetical protein [Timaviella obliquedivisa GSE-PSE-MK23-08B]
MNIIVPTFALLTKVLDPRHTIILRDWLEFLTIPPQELIIYMLDTEDVYQSVDALCTEFQLTWKPVFTAPDDDLANNETHVLLRMVKQVESEYLLFINLDTLPYRQGVEEEAWLQDVFAQMVGNDQFVFFSGCGVIFRDDKKLDALGNYLQTQRFSNNFGLLRKDFWMLAMQNHSLDQAEQLGVYRFHSEWALEEEFRQKNLFGLRRVETLNWRVFHVQQWGDRLFKTRDLFQRGVGIKRYLNRVHEDVIHRLDYHYNYPQPSLVRRITIWVGQHRRSVWSRLQYLIKV